VVSARRVLCSILGAAVALAGACAHAATPGVSGAFEPPARPVWAGEVFDLTLAWRVDWATFGNLEGPLTWKSDPLVAEPWGEPALRDAPSSGAASSAVIQLKTRAMALAPGALSLQPARQVMVLRTGTVRTDEYERAITAPTPVEGARGALNVRPLPTAPQGFSGAVGRFTLKSALAQPEVKVGDSVTWTVVLAGEGNWPAIRGLPSRQVSRDFDVVGAPKLKEDPGAKLFDRSLREEVTLVPLRAGRYVLGAVEMIIFDPETGRYQRLQAPPITVDVQPGPGGDLGLPASDAGHPRAAPDEEALPPLLKGTGTSVAPPADLPWLLGLAAAPVAILGLWLLLALQRAYERDPDRVARGAHSRLRATLDRFARTTDVAERRRLVRAWQRDVALRWKLGRAAPVPESFGEHDGWRALWVEADRFLYARAGDMAPDWGERAQRLWSEQGPPPPFAPSTTFRPANLLPAVCAVGVVLACCALPKPSMAQSAAEGSIRASLHANPLDWRARHNLAVTLAAQKRWDEAAGQAAVAWIQQPAAPETRALWTRTAREGGYSLEPGSSVPRPSGWRGRAIAVASPAGWRWMALAFAWVGVGGAATLLFARFHGGRRPLMAIGAALVVVAACGGVAAAAALSAYGVLARPDAVLVWKAAPLRALPVYTPAESAPAQLAAGVAGRVDRSFLGWRRVRFSDGRAGWLRQEALIWVWTRPH
jgi:hypothetical protein